jgi:hypothetical protein
VCLFHRVLCVHRDTHRHVHTQMHTGHYELPPTCVHERGGLDLVRFNSLWKSNVLPEDLQVQDIVNIMFPRAYFGGDDVDSTDEDTNFTQTSSSSGLRDDTHFNEKRHRARYFNKTDNKVKRVTDAARFQDGLNEFKGQRTRKILSQDLISFDNLDEYDEFKDYSDPVFSDDITKVFSSKDNTKLLMGLSSCVFSKNPFISERKKHLNKTTQSMSRLSPEYSLTIRSFVELQRSST